MEYTKEEWARRTKKHNEAIIMIAASRACTEINPSNPLAAADGIKGVVEALESAEPAIKYIRESVTGYISSEHIDVGGLVNKIDKALTRIKKEA